MEQKVILARGDIAPPIAAPSSVGEGFILARMGGKSILLCFLADLASANGNGRRLLEAWREEAALFDGQKKLFVGISYNPKDLEDPLVKGLPEGMIVLSDPSFQIGKSYGVMQNSENGAFRHAFAHFILRPNGTIASIVPAQFEPFSLDSVLQEWKKLPVLPSYHSMPGDQAPVLIIQDVFEPALCKILIEGYRKNGGEPSGFMKEVDGRTVVAVDPKHKIRSDWNIQDQNLILATQNRIFRRIVPHIAKCFQFHATRVERHIVACYDSKQGGHFRAHRDNTTKGTAHRRFAVTINLNAEEFEGGELTFPEFGTGTYRAPTGGAVVFSCSLTHQALPVTAGERFCFLPFLYDEAAAKIREANSVYLGDGLAKYKA